LQNTPNDIPNYAWRY